MQGRIIKALAGFYYVEHDGVVYQTRARGNFRKKGQTPYVGDFVEFSAEENSEGYILKIGQRINSLVRPPIVNIDQAVVIMSAKEPDFNSNLLDRFLVLLEHKNIKPVIYISKMDLVEDDSEMKAIQKQYQKIGFDFIFSLEELLPLLTDKITVFMGQTGVGKSTLFKLIMGYEKNSSGVIRLDGEDIRNYDISELISYTDQNEHIYRAGIVDNITVFHSYPMDGIDSVGKSIWPELFEGIFNRKEKECQRFSGGEKQAVAFLRMAAKNAEVILLDEPFSAMDAKMKSAVEHYLFTGKEFEGKTVLVITHDTREESLSQYDGIINVGENGIYVE